MNDLFDATTLNGLVERINKLTPETQRQWGTMSVAQMLKHVQGPIDQATGALELKIPFFLKLFGPGLKRRLLEGKYGKGGATAPSYKVIAEMDFDREKAMAIRKLRELAARGADFFEGRKHPPLWPNECTGMEHAADGTSGSSSAPIWCLVQMRAVLHSQNAKCQHKTIG